MTEHETLEIDPLVRPFHTRTHRHARSGSDKAMDAPFETQSCAGRNGTCRRSSRSKRPIDPRRLVVLIVRIVVPVCVRMNSSPAVNIGVPLERNKQTAVILDLALA